MHPPISRRPAEDQIRAILGQRAFAWAVDQLPTGVSIDDVTFADLVSVTRDDVERWVEEYGFDSTTVRDEDDGVGAEGLYVIPEDDGCVAFNSERGKRTFEHTASSTEPRPDGGSSTTCTTRHAPL